MPKLKYNLYLYEALGLGIFMFSAGFFDILIDHPDLTIRKAIHSDMLRRFFIGLTMGGTALLIMYSYFGKKSGAYINPAVTLTYYRLRKINGTDAFFYCLFQFIGGTIGLWLISICMPVLIQHPSINYIVTIPGKEGNLIAFIAEFIISFGLLLMVLIVSNNEKLKNYTPFFVATFITLYITFEAPYSGMSMNPARTFSSSIVANIWTSVWIYFTAPVFAMLFAGEIWMKYFDKK